MFIPRATGEFELFEKKSRFIGVCDYCESEEAAKSIVAALRKKHYNARHVCYAWRLCADSATMERSSDDGEPQGTAGAQILGALRRTALCNAACAVVRYFGGTLLGTGGLSRAYASAASGAIEAAGVIEWVEMAQVAITVDYKLEQTVRGLCCDYEVESAYSEAVRLTVTLPKEESAGLVARVTTGTRGAAVVEAV